MKMLDKNKLTRAFYHIKTQQINIELDVVRAIFLNEQLIIVKERD